MHIPEHKCFSVCMQEWIRSHIFTFESLEFTNLYIDVYCADDCML